MTDRSGEERAVLVLPPKPVGFDCFYAGVNWAPVIDCPKHLPRTAVHVATVEWSWSPAHSRQDAYHLSTNRSRSHWILWFGYFDDNETFKWVHTPYAFGSKKGVLAKAAAACLLLTGWQGEIAEYESSLDPFHMIIRDGLLSVQELCALAKQAWPRAE